MILVLVIGLLFYTAAVDGAKIRNMQIELLNRTFSSKGPISASQLEKALRKSNGEDTEISIGLHDTIRETDSGLTASGTYRKKFVQCHENVCFHPSAITLEVDAEGKATGDTTGTVVENTEADIKSTKAQITPEQAKEKAVENWNCNSSSSFGNSPEPKLTIYVKDQNGDKAQTLLVYRINMRCNVPFKRGVVVVDARRGTIVEVSETTAFFRSIRAVGGSIKQGLKNYEIHVFHDKDYEDQEVCFYKNDKVELMDGHGKFPGPFDHFLVRGFPCDAAKDSNGFDKYSDRASAMNDVFYFSGLTYEMFVKHAGRAPIVRNRQTEILRVKVHHGNCFDQAAWDGDYVLIGDGCHLFHPLSDVDIVAHEVAHAFTDTTSDLDYTKSESGCLNEAFSDITGETAEFVYKKGHNDWLIGKSITKNRLPMRYMANPPDDGESVGHVTDYRQNKHGVHQCSGIYNKMFFLLSRKNGWTPLKGFEVFAWANRFFWHAHETFIGAGCKLVKAAIDKNYNTDDVKDALKSVGIIVTADVCRGHGVHFN